MENQLRSELELLKEEATNQGISYSPNIGLEKLKERMGGVEFNFEKEIINTFNEAILREKDAYSGIFDIKKGKFIFWFREKNEQVVNRFIKSLIQWVKTHNLSIDKLIASDIAITERSITLFPTRSPKPLSRKEREALKQGGINGFTQ